MCVGKQLTVVVVVVVLVVVKTQQFSNRFFSQRRHHTNHTKYGSAPLMYQGSTGRDERYD